MGIEVKEIADAIDAHGKAIGEFKNAAFSRFDQSDKRLDEMEARMNRPGTVSHGFKHQSAGSMLASKLLETDEVREIQRNGLAQKSSIRINLPDVETKAVIVGDDSSSPRDGYPVQPLRDGRNIYGHPFRMLNFVDLLPMLPMQMSNSYEFVRTTNKVDNAGYQAYEGAVKSETTVGFDLQTAPIKTIAHFVTASRQVLDDAPMLGSFIETKMVHGVRQKLENELLNGTGTGGAISGFLTEASLFISSTEALLDQISEAITAIQVADYEPSAIVMHPQQWHQIRVARGDDGQFLAGSYVNPVAHTMWGLPVVTTRSIENGTVLIGDFQRGCALLWRMGVAFEISRENSDNFTRNLITMLAELRAGLAIYDPAAFLKVQLGSPVLI